jgi:DNA modification methylase
MDKYYIHDARNLSEVVQTKVDLIITSPPYFDMKDYGSANQIGFGQQYIEYLNDMRKVLNQCNEVANDSASLWMVVDTLKKDGQFKLLPFDLVAEAEKVGWKLQDIVIWKKDKTLPFSRRGEMRNIFEYVLYFVKSENFKYYPDRITEFELKEWWLKYPERYSPNGKAKSDVWEFPIPVQGSWGNHYVRHFCPLPSKMIDQIIELCTDVGDVVLDPFAGSGAVLSEAHKLKRKYVGCDLNPDFKKMFLEYSKNVDIDTAAEKSAEIKVAFGNTINALRILKWPSALLKKLRQTEGHQLENVLGVVIENSADDDKRILYKFILKKKDEKLQNDILSISTRPPFTKYGIDLEVRFEYKLPSHNPEWEYSWISTHKTPKRFEGNTSPYIASDIHLNYQERKLVDTFLTTGKIGIA